MAPEESDMVSASLPCPDLFAVTGLGWGGNLTGFCDWGYVVGGVDYAWKRPFTVTLTRGRGGNDSFDDEVPVLVRIL
ncbi:hypothetical protein BDN67DRAFT_965807 [Paxillus ammoniavirescens]|nr:hypothetical protein BDN67DRAFT_965807 [Paxillus ammoniavirescens]